MVPILTSGKSIKSIGSIVKYNEQKVAAGGAKLIGEGWYGKDLQDMTRKFKVQRLQDLAIRHMGSTKPAFHLSLNFSNKDRLSEKQLFKIAQEYLDRIGLKKQPFLVYQHLDAGHPHIHIVSVKIRPSGELIMIYEQGANILRTARMEIEKKYGLEPPLRKHSDLLRVTPPGDRLVPVEYGKCETGVAVSNVVYEVLNQYKVTSVREFNAVLSQFNIKADPGRPGTKTYLSGSVFYGATIGGKRIGYPVNARRIEGFPKMKNLEALFLKNSATRAARKDMLVRKLDSILLTRTSDIGFLGYLRTKGISVMFEHAENGQLTSISYIDNSLGVVYEGTELGKEYSAATLSARFENFQEISKKLKIAARTGKSVSYISSAIRQRKPETDDSRLSLNKSKGLRI